MLTLASFLAQSSVALAVDFQSSRTLSLARGGRGGALLNDTITLNPSLLGFQPIASVSGTMDWQNAQTTTGPSSGATPNGGMTQAGTSRYYNASVIDGKNEYVNAGLSFTHRPDAEFTHVALAKRALNWLSFGASVKRFKGVQNPTIPDSFQGSGWDGGVSASVGIPKELMSTPLQFGITADNLIDKAATEPVTGPRQVAFGVKTNINDILLLYGDAVENFSRVRGAFPTFSGAAEISLAGDFYARGGMFGWDEKGWSAGGGWVGPKFGISYGYQRKTSQAPTFQHAVTMDLYM